MVKKKVSKKNKSALKFEAAFNYPFGQAKRMLNIFWILIPIVGWFALGGYLIRIIQGFSKGKFKQLPSFKFKKDLKLGFFMFLKALPFIFAYIVLMGILGLFFREWVINVLDTLFSIFIIPIMVIHFINKETISSFFEFKILKSVFNNLKDYILALLKGILLGIVFFLMIIVLVGIPAGIFTQNIFLADFYCRNIK